MNQYLSMVSSGNHKPFSINLIFDTTKYHRMIMGLWFCVDINHIDFTYVSESPSPYADCEESLFRMLRWKKKSTGMHDINILITHLSYAVFNIMNYYEDIITLHKNTELLTLLWRMCAGLHDFFFLHRVSAISCTFMANKQKIRKKMFL